MKKGYFTFVLHSHLPYVRNAGRWPHGEEMIHEALAETYIPLLNALHELKDEGVKPRLTLGLTPILVEQIKDKDVLDHFALYAQEKLQAATDDQARFVREGETHLAYVAGFYQDYYRRILTTFNDWYHRDVVGAFRRLQDEGILEILTSAATHAYLPLIERDSSIFGQLNLGVETYRRTFGRAPRGIWLPECGYRPAYYREDGTPVYKPGLEEFLAEFGLQYFFTDTHVIQGGRMLGKVAGDVFGPYGTVPSRKLVVKVDERAEPVEKTTFRPYYVQSTHVAVYGRDERTGLQVWSAAHGYPGDYVYREFHRKDAVSGLQYWRVTDNSGDLGRKQPYDPNRAFAQTQAHAEHFCQLVNGLVADYHAAHGSPGVVVSAYDTELFGHWWFEGVNWLKDVLRELSKSDTVELTTAGDYLQAYPPQEVVTLPESSWGMGGGHWTWSNEQTAWMWPLIHAAERRMEQLVEQYPTAEGDRLTVLNQAARELVLLESSDWPFLVSTGQAKDYANGRFQSHLARFNTLCYLAEKGDLGESDRLVLETAWDADNPFAFIDYRTFRNREGRNPQGAWPATE
ncbi:MAG: DUF1957 domain-containing protein [Chloroflexota bacterium]|nr:MAG: DUF1957 domain-containing protein [Chloroflexota bacterium]